MGLSADRNIRHDSIISENGVSEEAATTLPKHPGEEINKTYGHSMYAVIEIGGHQYKVSENDTLFVNRLKAEEDEKISIDRVLLLKDDKGKVKVGKPVVKGAKVEAKVVDHLKDDKVIVFKKKRRKGYRVKRGHRQPLTRLQVEKIS